MNRAEQRLARLVADYLDLVSGGGQTFWWTRIEPGGARTKAEAAILKGLGVKAGCPDLMLMSNGMAFFCELKSAGGRLSSAQVGIHARLAAEGCRVAVARSLEEVDHLVADVWRLPMKVRPRLFGSAA